MSQKKTTVEYPPLLKWLRTLNEWFDIAQKIDATAATDLIWKNYKSDIIDWIDCGHGLMIFTKCTPDMAEQLMGWIERGIIDPQLVAVQLDYQDWHCSITTYVGTNDGGSGEETEYYPLKDSWNAAVGCAMIMTKTMLRTCDKSRAWLAEGMNLFYVSDPGEDEKDDTAYQLVDSSHEAWLQALCTKEPWVRELVVQWALENGATSPVWPWCYQESLGQAPSADFIECVLCDFDKGLDIPRSGENPKLYLLRTHAPRFYSALGNARQLYPSLYGEMPEFFLEQPEYLKNRAGIICGMFPQAMVSYSDSPGPSDTKSSMGKLFVEEPSSAA